MRNIIYLFDPFLWRFYADLCHIMAISAFFLRKINLQYPPFYGTIFQSKKEEAIFMLDKIKINVTAHTAAILQKDAEAFEFFKKDGRTLNKNALLTRLIVNYDETFRAKEHELFSYLKKKARRRTYFQKRARATVLHRGGAYKQAGSRADGRKIFLHRFGQTDERIRADHSVYGGISPGRQHPLRIFPQYVLFLCRLAAG